MQLFVIRHAKAAPAEAGAPDAARPLTPGGIRRFRRVVRGLASLDVEFDVVLHSPWVRAVQTADLLAGRCAGELRVDQLLAQAPQRVLFSLLEQLESEGAQRVALVGHQPWLGEFVAWGLTGATNAASNLLLRKGSVLWLEGDPVPGGLWLDASLPPKVLAALGR